MSTDPFTFRNLTAAGVEHFVTNRHGGVSKPPYDSLNLGLGVADDKEAVLENRRRVAAAAGIEPGQFVFLRQVHGDHIHVAGVGDVGRGATEFEDGIEADALITNQPGLCLMVLIADCVPVLLYDPVKKAVGSVHAGWRGTAAKLVRKAVNRLSEEFGTDPADVIAGIGPSIGPCHYVNPDARASLGDFMKGNALDLRAANRAHLEQAGVPAAQIEVAEICTADHQDTYFSHRGSGGKTGRFAGGIFLR